MGGGSLIRRPSERNLTGTTLLEGTGPIKPSLPEEPISICEPRLLLALHATSVRTPTDVTE